MRLSWAFHIDSVPFTAGVISGAESLGGSESACVGLARALAARGHDVHIFATKLDEACQGDDGYGVGWHPSADHESINRFVEWDVFVALRLPHVFGTRVRARYRVLWNQDLLHGEPSAHLTMALAWAYDRVAYVSRYHRAQWEGVLPELAPIGWVTHNGYDPSLVPAGVVKDPNRLIHISRPERGLAPLLAMWPEVRKANPHATMRLCRYNSMYDAQGWGKVCASFDEEVKRVHDAVGGIEWLGELGKPDLYRAIAESAAMWYPGIASFAETSCIAAMEAQACGTPFVGSWKGALPETVPDGILIDGDALSPEYQRQSIAAVLQLMDGCARQSVDYRARVQSGLAHVARYTFATMAEGWESATLEAFEARVAADPMAIVRQCLYEDDHVAAKACIQAHGLDSPEAQAALAFCNRVIDGLDQDASQYGAAAQDTAFEVEWEEAHPGRMASAVEKFDGVSHVLDVACGNGAWALMAARKYPALHVTGIDYSPANIERANAAAAAYGLSDRVRFACASVWDFADQSPVPLPADLSDATYDGAFVGEFLEHVANCSGLIDHVESLVADGGTIVYTTPHGPFTALMPRNAAIHRGHVHSFAADDMTALFRVKRDFLAAYLHLGETGRGYEVGHWLITHTADHARPPAGQRPIAQRNLTRRPFQRLTVGILTKDVETTIAKCLSSVYQIADEILLGDTGSSDGTIAAALAYESRCRVVPLRQVYEYREGFAGARNDLLSHASGEWFLWVDADEELLLPRALPKYLDSVLYHGYALKQHHVQVDAPPHFDRPIRLFRRRPDIQFYGCVHEQPQMGDCNTDILPALEASDCPIAHYGYIHEGIRRGKMLDRNLALLMRDQDVFPDRELGKCLWVREYFNHAQVLLEKARGGITENAVLALTSCVQLFTTHFADPANKYHPIARPFYEGALKLLNDAELRPAWEMEIGIGGRFGGMQGKSLKPERVWVQSMSEYERLVAHRIAEAKAKTMPPQPDVRPVVQRVAV